MKKKTRRSVEQIIRILREADGGESNEAVCRKHGISAQTFYRWKSRYGGMELKEAQRLCHDVRLKISMRVAIQVLTIVLLLIGVLHSALGAFGILFFPSTYGESLLCAACLATILGIVSLVVVTVPPASGGTNIMLSLIPFGGLGFSVVVAIGTHQGGGAPSSKYAGDALVILGFIACVVFLMMRHQLAEQVDASQLTTHSESGPGDDEKH